MKVELTGVGWVGGYMWILLERHGRTWALVHVAIPQVDSGSFRYLLYFFEAVPFGGRPTFWLFGIKRFLGYILEAYPF